MYYKIFKLINKTKLLTPFNYKYFFIIWIANLFANIGMWAQSVASAWIVTTYHASPFIVAMIQVSTAMPLVIFSIISGVLADNYDRRNLMLISITIECLVNILITIMSFLNCITPYFLLVSILGVSMGASFTVPAWQSAVNEQVPPSKLSYAVLLNGVNYNVARAIGPALGGIMINYIGPSYVFLFNFFCYIGIIFSLWQWRRDINKNNVEPERIFEGIITALKFIKHSSVIRYIMIRSFYFSFSASTIFALLPLIAHHHNNNVYGYMLGALGLGAILGSIFVYKLRKLMGVSGLISFSSLIISLILLTIGYYNNICLLFIIIILIGIFWMAVIASCNSSIHILIPYWIKARALALYQTALYAGIAFGSLLWGRLADIIDINCTFILSGILLILISIMLINTQLPEFSSNKFCRNDDAYIDFYKPSFIFNHERGGSIIVSIEYQIKDKDILEFINTVQLIRKLRLRNGAYIWYIYRDIKKKEIWKEIYLVKNWLQHKRMLDRLTIYDKLILNKLINLLNNPPIMKHGVIFNN
ncbi:Major Facilitator Superfamily permease [Candidatus Johnevansia muelleri]|uniref:Major Facilitator Superfamily permease n=1 Tax=Candidatus Johnevansia muelleri TaxID=1495769 RepID=A0A078KAX6_9GAMM|nr:Major Facilitator Superfamily permease [Candidatus Evansia muelleri]